MRKSGPRGEERARGAGRGAQEQPGRQRRARGEEGTGDTGDTGDWKVRVSDCRGNIHPANSTNPIQPIQFNQFNPRRAKQQAGSAERAGAERGASKEEEARGAGGIIRISRNYCNYTAHNVRSNPRPSPSKRQSKAPESPKQPAGRVAQSGLQEDGMDGMDGMVVLSGQSGGRFRRSDSGRLGDPGNNPIQGDWRDFLVN